MMTSATEGSEASGLLRTDLYIDGQWRAGGDGVRTDVVDPSTGELVAQVADATRDDVLETVAVAERAFVEWSRRPAPERSRILRRWFDLIVEEADGLAEILTAEQGKPLAEARGEIIYGAGFVEWYAEEAKRVYGEIIPPNVDGRRIQVTRSAIGVTCAITPWNFPSAMILRKVAPALAAGCTMIVKPASETPLSAFALAELAHRAGVPAGVLNVVHGDAAMIGDVLTTHESVRALSFTGSTAIGKLLMKQSSSTVKKLALELGGNAPLIVFDDADLDEAVKGAVASKFRNAGQTCVCANRILVQDGIHDRFVEAFTAAVRELKVGDGRDPESTQGPLISQAAVDKVSAHVADAVDKGATVLLGGRPHELGGTYFEPTVLDGARPDMVIAHEETFGPVAPIFTFSTEDEAVAMANDTPFGLAAYFFSHDLGRVTRVSEALEFGVVGVNTGLISYEGAPFGGVKQSGLGREGSSHGLDEFTELKYVCVEGIR
ncbi:NAD-dependent succinate-semialdehyde dehydrogenase [Aeromicrobium sp. CFBP 8757]|uniref:NAD-dependent succinate-semialdehyde dehydrogenase n=1 Tax=Aeromicrobium sp. CFBP 8757 TaxID=2775288 RepID=UPI0027393DB4|nr:NAD-dependent succinate-semialdehyde dehydrogenase [Aeromicrobium sp. CFBP 8757]